MPFMTLLTLVTEVSAEDKFHKVLPAILGLTVFGILALLLFLVTRLNPDR